MLSQTIIYAFRATLALGLADGAPLTVKILSEKTGVPFHYLAKVMQMLTKNGIATAQRGLNGGFLLSKEADNISLRDVLTAVSPVTLQDCCPLGLDAECQDFCTLSLKINHAQNKFLEVLERSTIKGLMKSTRGCQPVNQLINIQGKDPPLKCKACHCNAL